MDGRVTGPGEPPRRNQICTQFPFPITKPAGKYFFSPVLKIRYSHSPCSCDKFAPSGSARRYFELEKILVEMHNLGMMLYSSFEVVPRNPQASEAEFTQCNADNSRTDCCVSILTPLESKSEHGRSGECRRKSVPANQPNTMYEPIAAANEQSDEPRRATEPSTEL